MSIIAAMVNPIGPEPEKESVVLLNASPRDLPLSGWKLVDQYQNTQILSITIARHGVATVPLKPPMKLGNSGGLLTLLDPTGKKVQGVKYSKADAQKEGWLVRF